MKKKIKIIIADPAGNITIFVKDKFERRQYQQVAKQLLEMRRLGGEQVAFILETPECGRADGKVEMCGLEFCGNASRAFGLLKAREMGIKGAGKVFVDMSGCDEILTIDVNLEEGYTKVKMPKPLSITRLDLSELKTSAKTCEASNVESDETSNAQSGEAGNAESGEVGKVESGEAKSAETCDASMVNFDGIFHVVLQNVEASKETFDRIKDIVMKRFNPPAMGVMFYNPEQKSLIPVVYVKDVDTTFFEGSCGSGVTACAAALSAPLAEACKNGIYHFSFAQPGGTIDSTVTIADGAIENIFIEGTVGLSDEMEVEVEV